MSRVLAALLTTLTFVAYFQPAHAKPPSAPNNTEWRASDPLLHWLAQTRPRFALAAGSTEVRSFPNVPRRLLLDHAREWLALEDARQLLGADAGGGAGVVLGIVDSGIDALHPDLRGPQGESRLLWWIDFGHSAYGFYPSLEQDYGCTGELLRCGILGPEQLQSLVLGEELLTPLGERVALPADALGHGTHVASLALGNGQSNARYAGIAPQAHLIGARVATEGALVEDLDVMLAARFVFERAAELGMPAVLNLSLGGDIGPHDGSTQLERSLAEWVVEDAPGRAIVVAAGNSGSLYPAEEGYPAPLGIHTEVHVPRQSEVRVPIVVPGSGSSPAAFFVWITEQRGDSVAVALEQGDGAGILPYLQRGEARSASNGETQVSLVHHVASDLGVSDSERGIAVVVSGRFEKGTAFALLFQGEASLDLWIQSEGALSPEAGSRGALFPAASRERTITVPATSEDVIAVGATLNRRSWSSFGSAVTLFPFHPDLDPELGSVLFFSSAGPNARGVIKPDLVAPGGAVVGALARGAEASQNGRVNAESIFGFTPLCDFLSCAQVDENHGISLGTSMAAPLVSGVLALLLEQNPGLSQRELKALLQAGVTRVPGVDSQAGSGLLNAQGSVLALAASSSEQEPAGAESWLTFAESFARPAAREPLEVLLHVRDAQGRPLTMAPSELRVTVENGRVHRAPQRLAAGLFSLSLAAEAGSAGERLTLAVHYGTAKEPFARGALPIAVDSSTASQGVSVRGGCSLRPGALTSTGSLPLLLGFGWLLVTARRGRFRRRAAPTVRDRGRTDNPH